VLSVSARNVPTEYEVYYTVHYGISHAGTVTVPVQDLTLTRDSGTLRSLWDELERSEVDSSVASRAAQVEQMLAWACVRDILRGVRPESTQDLAFVLVQGSFRGLSFEDGAQADWMR